jgi:hypothetical protein
MGEKPFPKLGKIFVHYLFTFRCNVARVWWGPGTGVTHMRMQAAVHFGHEHMHEGMGTA